MKALIIAVALLLTGCVTVPANAPTYSRAAEPPAGQGNVYIYRIGAVPTLRTPTISIDGSPVFDPPEKAYTVVALPVGPHEVLVNWGWDTGAPDLKFPIQVIGATPLYIKITGSFETTGMSYRMGSLAQGVPQVIAEREIEACCRYLEPEQRK